MIYYPICTLFFAGIKDIAIITTLKEQPRFQELLGSGENWGVKFTYIHQSQPTGISDAFILCEEFLDGDSSILILGDNLFAGAGLGKSLQRMQELTTGAQILGYQVKDPVAYGVVEFNMDGQVISVEEKPLVPKSNYVIPGLYVVDSTASAKARTIKNSARGEKNITDFLQLYLNEGQLNIEVLQRGSAWMDMGSPLDLAATTDYIKVIEQRQGMKISCPEEVAWRNKWISSHQLEELGKSLLPSTYGEYLRSLVS